MDIHRCRFVPYPAAAINALAFSHSSSVGRCAKLPLTLRLAIGRANGDIEIWNPKGGIWVQEIIIKGGKDRSIEGLVWTHDLENETAKDGKSAGRLRLFSIGYSTSITEWDLALGKPIRHSSGNYGEIWCLAAQPRWDDTGTGKEDALRGTEVNQLLAVGCADGTLVLHSTMEGDLRFLRSLPRPSNLKSRVLSMAFQGRFKIVAGYSDSTIRIFETHGRGRLVAAMSLGAGPKGGPREILVWSVKTLANGTIVSGDSTGEVKIWDSKTNSLLQRIRSHKADVLDLAPSLDGMTMLSAGMDRRTTVYHRTGKGKGRWEEKMHQRIHTNDVKAMASFEFGEMSVVASGGRDATPFIVPLREFGSEYSRALPSFPSTPPIQSAPSQRLLMTYWDRNISIWRVTGNATVDTNVDDVVDPNHVRRIVAKIALQGEESITSASIAASGSVLAVSTISETKFFGLRWRGESKESLKIKKLQSPATLSSTGARLLQFSPDSKWLLVIGLDSSIYVYRMRDDPSTNSHQQVLARAIRLPRAERSYAKPKVHDGSHGDYERTITKVAWSSDSRIVVVGDLAGYLDSWMLEGHEDLMQDTESAEKTIEPVASTNDGSDDGEDDRVKAYGTTVLGQSWTRVQAKLPKLPSTPLVLSFRPGKSSSTAKVDGNVAMQSNRHRPHSPSHDLRDGEDRIVAVTSQHSVYEYRVLSGKVSDWSRRNPPSTFPTEFLHVRDRAMGCVWDSSGQRERVWLYGSTWLWMFDLSKDMLVPTSDTGLSGQADRVASNNLTNRKRKREANGGERWELTKNTSGAGNKVPADKLPLGVAQGMTKIVGHNSTWHGFSFDLSRKEDNDEDDDDYEDEGQDQVQNLGLMHLRREVGENEATNRNGVSGDGDRTVDQSQTRVVDGLQPNCWRTYKYRPILGITPLGAATGNDGDDSDHDNAKVGGVHDGDEYAIGLEAALVERPLWEADLAPRWEGNQEWNRGR